MFNDEFILKVKIFAQKNSDQDDIHGYPHVQRVFNTCIEMGSQMNANMLVLKISALLHDVGRIKEKFNTIGKNHADLSAEIAQKFLSSNQFNLSKDEIENQDVSKDKKVEKRKKS